MPALKRDKPFYLHLTFWVLIALVAAILLGHFFPDTAVKTEWMGKSFVNIIKIFIGPIIFLTIVLGITGMGNLKKAGRIGLKAVIYFEVVTTLALILGIVFANILQPGKINKEGLPASFLSCRQFRFQLDQFSKGKFYIAGTHYRDRYRSSVEHDLLPGNRDALSFEDHTLCFYCPEIRYVPCAAWRFWRNGLYNWKVWNQNFDPIGKADVDHVRHYGCIYFYCFGYDSSLL